MLCKSGCYLNVFGKYTGSYGEFVNEKMLMGVN